MDSTATKALQPPATLYLLLSACLAVAGYVATQWSTHNHLSLIDGRVYAGALNLWVSGKNPYDASYFGPFRFIYPPIFLYIGGFFARLMPQHWGWPLYLTLNFASTLALPIVLARFFFKQSWLNAPFVLLLFLAAPQYGGVQALMSGNLACPLYCMIFVAALPGLKKNQWGWFYAAIFLAASIKINFLIWLMLPILAGRRKLLGSSATAISVLAVNLLERLLLPDLYSAYQRSLHHVLIDENNCGFGVFGVMANLNLKLFHTIGTAPYWGMAAFIALLVSSLILLRRRMDAQIGSGVWLSFSIVGIALANPRILQYDISWVMVAVCVLFVNLIDSRRPLLVYLILFTVSIAVSLFVRSTPIQDAYETILLLGAFASMYCKLWIDSGKPALHEGAPITREQPSLIGLG